MKGAFLVTALLALTMTGCSSVQTAKNARGTGERQTYEITKKDMWPIMVTSVSNTGGSIKEKNMDQCYVLASYGMTAWSWGENVAVFCEQYGNTTEVEVVMEPALLTNVSAVKRAPQILNAISDELRK